MQEIIRWKVIPINEPNVIRNCSKCGGKAHFENSKKFRVNANQSKLDVWLIYQCKKCKTTWNMTILSRVNPKEIPNNQYKWFIDNDKELARFYAFDVDTHRRNGSILDYHEIEYTIEGKTLDIQALEEKVTILLECEEVFTIRMDKVLSRQLEISRAQVRSLVEKGILSSREEKKLWKAKLKSKMYIDILPQ